MPSPNRPSARPIRPAFETLRWIDPALLPKFAAARTDAHRLASSARTWVERLGEDVLISHQDAEGLATARQGLAEWAKANGLAVRRVFGRFLPRQNDDRAKPELLEGDAGLPLITTVMEAGLRYGIDFEAGYSAGLFLDQRANRALLRTAPPKRLLNTFAYTCSFSVVAASVGAETVSVDLSKKSIERGRGNFDLNGISQEGHQFIADDVLNVLPRLARRGEKFDAIVLDPPTFSRGDRGRRWQVEKDFPALVDAALEVASPGARILLSTNCTRLTDRDLEWFARNALKLVRRAGDLHRESALPDLPALLAAKTVWLTLR
jgi:23S rRNA (cytosine1962-C5)-methyltransferase